MSSPDQDEKLWRYLGGQPPSRSFSEKVCSDPEFADRLARLALIECSIREEATATEGQSILNGGVNFSLGGWALLPCWSYYR